MMALTNNIVRAARRRPRLSVALFLAIIGALAVMGGLVPASPFLKLAGWAIAEGGAEIEAGIAYGNNPRQRLAGC